MDSLRLVIVVRGGMVTEVHCTHPVLATVVDWDVQGDADSPDLFVVRQAGESQAARVNKIAVAPWTDLLGSATGKALEAVGVELSVDTDRRASELATVLAALRHWQAITREREVDGAVIQDIPQNLQLHFLADPPLSHAETNELCERLNHGDWP